MSSGGSREVPAATGARFLAFRANGESQWDLGGYPGAVLR